MPAAFQLDLLLSVAAKPCIGIGSSSRSEQSLRTGRSQPAAIVRLLQSNFWQSAQHSSRSRHAFLQVLLLEEGLERPGRVLC